MDASLTGSGQPKTKSINVEVNLLDAWVSQRSVLEHRVQKRVGLVALLTFLAMVILPAMMTLRSSVHDKAAAQKATYSEADQRRQNLKELATKATPGIQLDEMKSQCRTNSKKFLTQLAKVVNAAPMDVIFNQMKLEMMGGECNIKVTAEARDSDLGRAFVEQAGKGRNVLMSIQTAVHRSEGFGGEGVTFDYVKKVDIEK